MRSARNRTRWTASQHTSTGTLLLGSAVLAILAFETSPASAIVTRHDRDEESYRAIAKEISVVCEVGGGVGTLIDPQWILTAGHVAESVSVGSQLQLGEQRVKVDAVHVHPHFALQEKHRDLGLLHLAEPVKAIRPASLYRQSDENGKRTIFVGSGHTGNGKTGPVPGERIFRGAYNTVESTKAGWLTFRFDAPPHGDDLEGISGPGDSGGPALIERDGQLYIVGVSAYNDGSPPCTYGSIEYYSRVSDELPWIEGVMTGNAVPTPQPRAMRFGETDDGQATASREEIRSVAISKEDDDVAWRAIDGLVESFNSESTPEYRALFNPRCLEAGESTGDPVEGMFHFMVGAQEVKGGIARFHSLPEQGAQIPESEYPMRAVIFHLADGTPGYLGIALDSGGQIDHLSLFVRDGICPEGIECRQDARPIPPHEPR